MIRSMTAFSRGEDTGEWGELTLEIRSVNHRFLDISIRMPEEIRPFESTIRETISKRLSRGKIDLFVRYRSSEVQSDSLEVDIELARKLAHASREIDSVLYNAAPVNSIDVLRWPGVLKTSPADPEILETALFGILDGVLDDFVAMREREGAKLAEVLLQRCDGIEKVVNEVKAVLPEVLEQWQTRLHERLAELKSDMDPQRVEQEMVITAQKMDVEEEMDRLETHLLEVRRILKKGGPVGRRLDFLMQELNREANTLGSKSIDSRTTQASVELKVLIEQMREQVQNIE